MNLAALPQIHTKLIVNLLFPFPSREIWRLGFLYYVCFQRRSCRRAAALGVGGRAAARPLRELGCVLSLFPQIRPHFFYISICEEWKPQAFIIHKYARMNLRSEAPQIHDFFVNLSRSAAQIHKKHRKDEDRMSSSLRYSLVYGQKIWARREAPTLRF